MDAESDHSGMSASDGESNSGTHAESSSCVSRLSPSVDEGVRLYVCFLNIV